MGFKVMTSATANKSYHGFALDNLSNQILIAVVQFFVSVMFCVVVGAEIFQHITSPFEQGSVDVVEVKNVSLGVNHWRCIKCRKIWF